jgi:putative phosphoribosyl transferase
MALNNTENLTQTEVEIPSGTYRLKGTLSRPAGSNAVVVFAHGSGSGRFSTRNHFVAGSLQAAGIGTLLIDLLEEDEEDDREKVFDIELLAGRLQSAVDWLRGQKDTQGCRLGYFGASTGAAAAMLAAARRPRDVAAIVSRGGRPDMAADNLPRVKAPTLLIVGGNDDVVITLNEEALALLRCPKQMIVIPGATHLFPEPGALEEVASLASDWFARHFALPQAAR